eukprot:gene13908-4076_t
MKTLTESWRPRSGQGKAIQEELIEDYDYRLKEACNIALRICVVCGKKCAKGEGAVHKSGYKCPNCEGKASDKETMQKIHKEKELTLE